MILADCKPGTYVRCDRFRGVACIIVGPEYGYVLHEWDSDEEEVETGQVIIRMYGDDRRHVVDPDDCTPLDTDDNLVCDCGQIGCGWGQA